MRASLTFLVLFSPLAVVIGFQPVRPAAPQQSPKSAGAAVKAGHGYPDFGFLPARNNYEGRVFELSQDYPGDEPPAGDVPEVATRNFALVKANWRQYLLDVRTYCFEGNVGHPDVEDDWEVARNTKGRRWYHVPWQHFGPNGREGIHGMTKEAPVQPRQLAWTQTHTGGQTYAVGFYNEFGGYTIGQVFANPDHPGQVESPPGSGHWENRKKIEFPVGTVVCKVLFVDLDSADRVPYLDPPLKWQGYITKGYLSSEREIRSLSLIQMDIMVKHKDAPFGWVFGTFQYNGKKTGEVSWENLVPVGLQWGNDPDVTDDVSNPQPTKTVRNPKLRETVINPDDGELPVTHLGWNGRLNGPVDNPMSSCMSCHMTAATPQIRPISPLFQKDPPVPGPGKWMDWFQNLQPGVRFSPKGMPTDYSLQVAAGLQNFRLWRNEGSKLRYNDYKSRIARKSAVDKGVEDPHRVPTHSDDDGGRGEARIRRNDPRPLPYP